MTIDAHFDSAFYSNLSTSTRTEHAAETLCYSEDERRCNEVRINTHIYKTWNNTDSIVGVNGRKHKMSRESGLDSKLSGFFVPY